MHHKLISSLDGAHLCLEGKGYIWYDGFSLIGLCVGRRLEIGCTCVCLIYAKYIFRLLDSYQRKCMYIGSVKMMS